MIQKFIAASIGVLLLASCSSVLAQKGAPPPDNKPDPKFINDIEVVVEAPAEEQPVKNGTSKFAIFKNLFLHKPVLAKTTILPLSVEEATSLQLKYSLLLDTDVEEVHNISLFNVIDDWYGTPYLWGGTTKKGIDCSAFVQSVYAVSFGLSLPRTAREQHKASKIISRAELKQGDLLFFNTIGGVSHVGMYLQNNKFVHSASSGGVMISDVYDPYWVKRFIAAGRVETAPDVTALSRP